MKYAITTSKELGPECQVPLEPELPTPDPESTIEDWELVSTVYQHTRIERQVDLEGNLQRDKQVTLYRANKCEIEGGWSLTQGFSVDHFVNGDIECGPNHGVGKGRIQYDPATRSASYALPGGRSHGPSVGPLMSGIVATLWSGDPSLAWIRFTVGRLPKAGGIAQLIFTSTESIVPGLPFTYTDDICQIGEHDVHLGGVELTKDIGEFKAGQKFDGASIDFHGGHLTFETAAGREHRYNFELKVGAKHEGHTCSGCAGKVGELCREHS